jgi:mutator protein MutT
MKAAPYLVERSAGYLEYQLPISLKGVVVWQDHVPLLQNERDEWELPGGKLEVGETPRECLHRELAEELSWDVEVGDPFHLWVYEIRPDRHVLVVTYLAAYRGATAPRRSSEHKELKLFPLKEAVDDSVNMPAQYKDAIRMVLDGRVDVDGHTRR